MIYGSNKCVKTEKIQESMHLPRVNDFHPKGGAKNKIILNVDEYETIRLTDKEGFSRKECACGGCRHRKLIVIGSK